MIEAVSPTDRDECLALRRAVFCDEQGVAAELEFDGLDGICRHYLALADDRPVGTARLRPLGEAIVKIERVAVLRPSRRLGIGLALMQRALADARKEGRETAILHAQSHADAFYRRLGFRQEGDGFMEAGIAHIRMTLDL